MKGVSSYNNKEMVKKKKANNNNNNNRILITINVLGSPGPLRFVGNEDDLVCEVIQKALKSYAREGRLPLLPSHSSNFLLYSAHSDADALNPNERIGSKQARNFVLYKKQETPLLSTPHNNQKMRKLMDEKGSHSWKAWLNKSLSFKIQSH